MTDLSSTIAPKSDQMNADDLIGRSLTIKVTKVSKVTGDQPIAINYEGDQGKPYKPCKSMRRVLVNVWGTDGTAYAGRSMTLFRDENVRFGPDAVGGIRISHMSHITKDVTLALTASRGNRKPYTVQPLKIAQSAAPKTPTNMKPADIAIVQSGNEAAAKGVKAYVEWRDALAPDVKESIRHLNTDWSKTAKKADEDALAGDSPINAKSCETCGGSGIFEDENGKGPCMDCQGG